jgi:membrane protease YdiL (CAAX protease family)
VPLWLFCVAFLLQLVSGVLFWHGEMEWLATHVAAHFGGWVDTTLIHCGSMFLLLAAIFTRRCHLRWSELGLATKGVPVACGAFAAGWLAVQLLAAAPALWGGQTQWTGPAFSVPVTVGDLAGQLFGNALEEELLFRALLFAQLTEALAGRLGRSAPLVVMLLSQAGFSLSHLPAFVALGGAPADAALYFGSAFGVGCLFCGLWLRSGNLWVCVAMHAIFNWHLTLVTSEVSPLVSGTVVLVVMMLVWPRAVAPRAPTLQPLTSK